LANKQWVEHKALGNRLVDKVEQLLSGARTPRPEERIERAVPQPPKKSPRISPVMIGSAVAVCVLLAGGAVAWQVGWRANPDGAQVLPRKDGPAASDSQIAVVPSPQPPLTAPPSPAPAIEPKAPDPPAALPP